MSKYVATYIIAMVALSGTSQNHSYRGFVNRSYLFEDFAFLDPVLESMGKVSAVIGVLLGNRFYPGR